MGRARPKKAFVTIDLADFTVVGPNLHPAAAAHFGASASVCLRLHRARGQIGLRLVHSSTELSWKLKTLRVTKAMRATYADLQDATEHGAYGIALLAAGRRLGATLAQRAYKGPGFDFFLQPPGGTSAVDDDDIFAGKWALEVSGSLRGGRKEVHARLREKRSQVASASADRPALVAIVEFSEPSTTLELHDNRPRAA